MKLTIKNHKLVPFDSLENGTVFKDPASRDDYYIKGESVLTDSGCEELNAFNLNENTFESIGAEYLVQPITNAELIIP